MGTGAVHSISVVCGRTYLLWEDAVSEDFGRHDARYVVFLS